MKRDPFASLLLTVLGIPACPRPTRCPYCPADAPCAWTRSGGYTRYAGDLANPSRCTRVPRCKCKRTGRTFSLPPDALLPYCGIRTGYALQCLHAMFARGAALNTLARRAGLGRGALRCLKARFSRVVRQLRLPWHEGMLGAADFLAALAAAGARAVADLFRSWKESEPKFSVVGIYAR